jgi:hypothetical protein
VQAQRRKHQTWLWQGAFNTNQPFLDPPSCSSVLIADAASSILSIRSVGLKKSQKDQRATDYSSMHDLRDIALNALNP